MIIRIALQNETLVGPPLLEPEGAAGNDVARLNPLRLPPAASRRLDRLPGRHAERQAAGYLEEEWTGALEFHLEGEVVYRADAELLHRFAPVLNLPSVADIVQDIGKQSGGCRVDDTPPGVDEVVGSDRRSIRPSRRQSAVRATR